MSGSVNKAIVVGNLGGDPDIRRSQDGRPIASFSVATSETWRDKTSGERKERTQWHRVVIFSEPLCKLAEQYLHKGSKVYLEGQMETRKWVDQGGADRYTTEVVLRNFNSVLTLLDKREGVPGNNDIDRENGTRTGGVPPRNSGGISSGRANDIDDDIPF